MISGWRKIMVTVYVVHRTEKGWEGGKDETRMYVYARAVD